jgi:predicted secreted protein
MIIKGNSLIVSSGGEALAASKSCSIDVQNKTIPVSTPTSGQWEANIAGRNSWSLTTNHLLISKTLVSHTMQAISRSYGPAEPVKIIIDGRQYTTNLQTRGIVVSVFVYGNNTFSLDGTSVFDTYAYADEDGALFANMLSAMTAGTIVVMTSFDALSITSTMRSAMLTAFPNLSQADIPLLAQQRAAFSLIGVKGDKAACATKISENNNAHVTLFTDNQGQFLTDTMVKNMVAKIGQIYALKIQTEGFVADVLRGNAICQTCRLTGTQGNLLQGSFSFKGSGPLS